MLYGSLCMGIIAIFIKLCVLIFLMEEEKAGKELQEVNITALWNNNIFESIQRLQDFERICRDGAVSITEYLNIAPARMPEIQFQYLRMMVSELGILLGNARARISKGFFLKSRIQLKHIKNIIDLDPKQIFQSSLNQQNHSTQNFLSEAFYKFLSDLSMIREGIVVELQDILYGITTPKASGMEKQQAVIRQ